MCQDVPPCEPNTGHSRTETGPATPCVFPGIGALHAARAPGSPSYQQPAPPTRRAASRASANACGASPMMWTATPSPPRASQHASSEVCEQGIKGLPRMEKTGESLA